EVHPARDRIEQTLVAEHLIAEQQKRDVLPRDIVVERQIRRVVGVAVLRELIPQRIALRPSANGILTVEDELNRLVERRLVLRIELLDVQPEQERRRIGRDLIVERRVAVVVLEFFEAPRISPDGRIPILERSVAREIDDIVPTAARM